MPIAYVLINSDLGTDVSIITKIKEILAGGNDVQYEIQGVYGVYDIILKLSSTSSDALKSIITNKIRKINKIIIESIMFRIILKNKFKERKIDLSIAVKVMYHQKFTGSIQSEHIKWWKRYWIKPIMLEILYPKKGWIQLVKIFREGKPSIRVITTPTSSAKRELLVHKQLYGEEVLHEQKRKKKLEQFRNKQKNMQTTNIAPNME